jgi:hypothetical protein
MDDKALHCNLHLRQALWACHASWQGEDGSRSESPFGYLDVLAKYRRRFRSSFHHATMMRLAQLGYLLPVDAKRGDGTRRYTLNDATRVGELLPALGLPAGAMTYRDVCQAAPSQLPTRIQQLGHGGAALFRSM